MKEKRLSWDSPLVRSVRWVALFPLVLGLFWLVELFLNQLLAWWFDWRLEGLVFYLVFVVGGLVLVLVMILASRVACKIEALIAPHVKVGLVLLGIAYATIQLVGLFRILGEFRTGWPHFLMKVEFTVVALVVFVLAYRAAGRAPEAGADLEQKEGS